MALAPLAADLRSGRLDVVDHVEAVLERVDAIEPGVLALLPEPGRRGRLLAEAAALRERWPDPAARPPLYGILLGVKDLFAADGFLTRAGSRLPPELFAMAEGPMVAALKAAGALVLGKTVTTEFAYFSPGPTRNPWDTARTPGGSSSGSAAAVAAGFCPLAVGTQTIGSISRPAAFCGVVGWKPGYDRTSRDGIVPFSPSLDHAGLFAADVAGIEAAAPLVTADWRPGALTAARARYSSPGGLPALLVPDGAYLAQAEPEALEAFERQLDLLRGAGFRVVRIPAFPDIEDVNARHRRIAAAELERVHRAWFAGYGALYSETTADLIRKGAAIGDGTLAADREGRFDLRATLERLMAEAGAEYWLTPAATGPAPLGLGATGSPIMNLPWTHAGLPTLAIPAGLSAEGMPLGLQVAARYGEDETLMAAGEVLEEALRRAGAWPIA